MNNQTEIENKTYSLKVKQIISWTALLTPTLLFVAMFFMGVGYGTYFFGKLFFPIPMIIAGIDHQINDLALWLAVFQIPLYGFILYLTRQNKWKIVGLGITVVHFISFFIAMNLASGFD